MTRVALAALAAALAAGCAATSSPAARPTPTGSPQVATGRVELAVVAVCGAGSRPCPRRLIQLSGRHLRQHDGYFFATPDTAFVGGQGCGADFPGPVGSAMVTRREIRLTVDWTNLAGQDCFGSVFAFVHFTKPVFDMHTPIQVTGRDRMHHRTFHTQAWPAADLATWADGRGMRVLQRPID